MSEGLLKFLYST